MAGSHRAPRRFRRAITFLVVVLGVSLGVTLAAVTQQPDTPAAAVIVTIVPAPVYTPAPTVSAVPLEIPE